MDRSSCEFILLPATCLQKPSVARRAGRLGDQWGPRRTGGATASIRIATRLVEGVHHGSLTATLLRLNVGHIAGRQFAQQQPRAYDPARAVGSSIGGNHKKRFERGTLSRRQLISGVTLLAAAGGSAGRPRRRRRRRRSPPRASITSACRSPICRVPSTSTGRYSAWPSSTRTRR